MASILSILRRIGGLKAAPAMGSAGQLALWKAGAKPTDAASLYAHDGTQWVEVLDTRGQVVSPHITTIGATAPTSPKPQDMWLNTTTNLLSIWDGATWVSTDTHQAATSVIAPVNPTAGSMWLDPGKKDLMVWDGSQWANVAFKNVTNTFIKPQIIDVNDASAALHIKQLGTGAALYIEDETNPDTTPFVVDKDGNVGVGVAAPTAKLDVAGTAVITANDAAKPGLKVTQQSTGYPVDIASDGSNYSIKLTATNPVGASGIQFTDGTTTYGYVIRRGTSNPAGKGLCVATQNGDPIIFMVNNVDIARFDGTTGSFLVSLPTPYKDGTYGEPQLQWGARTGYRAGAVAVSDTAGAQSLLLFKNNNGIVGRIETNGSATAYLTSSDYRLKENLAPLTGAAARLSKIPVHRFNFKADPDKTVDGFLAHEVAAIIPEAVSGDKDAVDTEGKPNYQAIDQSKLVPLLTAALQEALKRIEALEAKLTP